MPVARPTRPRPAVRRARLAPAERREQLLGAAAGLLLAEGPGALTMERLAERAGVSKGLGYAYFRDAQDVALALWDREVSEIYRRVEVASDATDDFQDAWRRAIATYFDVITERGALLGALQSHFIGATGRQRMRRRVRAFLAFWSERVARVYAVTPARATTLAAMMLNAADAAGRCYGAGLLDREAAERTCLDFLMEGLAGAGAPEQGRPGG